MLRAVPELQLPCPPLESWLPDALGRDPVGLVEWVRPVRRLRPLLDVWPNLEDLAVIGTDPDPATAGDANAGFDAVVIVGELGTPPEITPALRAKLRRGAHVVELVDVRAGWLGAMFGLERPRLRRAEHAARRVLTWSLLGLHDLEQWMSPDPADVVVTRGRWSG